MVEFHPQPVIYKAAAIKEHGVRFGFEGGTAHKVEGRYYLFSTENVDEPKNAVTKLALWTSEDGNSFSRHRTVWEFTREYPVTDFDRYRTPWSPMVVWNDEANCWSLFYVDYRHKPGTKQLYNLTGEMHRLDAQTPGLAGIVGPWKQVGPVDFPSPPDKWEGICEVVSFFPYRVGEQWLAFYGSNSAGAHIPGENSTDDNVASAMKFHVGLAVADSIDGPYHRCTAKNPVLMDDDFVENPVVRKITHEGVDFFINVYDGANDHGISYSLSMDGWQWSKEKVLDLPALDWMKGGTRTPLGLIPEEDGTYTIFFTAFDGVNPEKIEPLWHDGFGQVGRVRVRFV